MTRKRCQKLESVKLMSRSVLSGVGDDVILYREFLKRKGSTLDVACDELLALLRITPFE
jgi:hypothetical protein